MRGLFSLKRDTKGIPTLPCRDRESMALQLMVFLYFHYITHNLTSAFRQLKFPIVTLLTYERGEKDMMAKGCE